MTEYLLKELYDNITAKTVWHAYEKKLVIFYKRIPQTQSYSREDCEKLLDEVLANREKVRKSKENLQTYVVEK